jgi:hypothetical protein
VTLTMLLLQQTAICSSLLALNRIHEALCLVIVMVVLFAVHFHMISISTHLKAANGSESRKPKLGNLRTTKIIRMAHDSAHFQ